MYLSIGGIRDWGIWNLEFGISSLGFDMSDLEFVILGVGVWIWDPVFEVWDLGFGV